MIASPSPSKRPPTPGWVKIFAAVGAILMVIFIALHLTGRGFGHGP